MSRLIQDGARPRPNRSIPGNGRPVNERHTEGFRLPSFFVVGAARSGTSSLHHYLGQHPDVFMSSVKEPTYFALAHLQGVRLPSNTPYEAGLIYDWKEYTSLFAGAGAASAVGESSTWYLHSPEAPAAIRKHVPDARIIILLRHPVDRAYSHFRLYRRGGFERIGTLQAALRAEPRRRRRGWPVHYQYSHWSRYAEPLGRYYDLFPPHHIRLYRYEQLRDDAPGLIADAFRFLGVDPSISIDSSQRLNAAPAVEPNLVARLRSRGDHGLSPRLRRRLARDYMVDLDAVDHITGQDFSSWARE